MNKSSTILSLFIPLFFFTQKKYEEDSKIIYKNCDETSVQKAQKIYDEIKLEQTENSFDRTLNGFYQFLESTNCKKYNNILITLWKNDKVINENSFRLYFKNSDINYHDFLYGYSQKKSFRFANLNNLDQGIDNELQLKMLNYVKSKSLNDYKNIVSLNIDILEGHELTNFISSVKTVSGLKIFEKEIINKSLSINYPFDLNHLLNELIDLKTDKATVENILNKKIDIWDKGNWSEKFWPLIKQQNFKVQQSTSYTVNYLGTKKYDVKKFLNEQKKLGLIGDNPTVFLDYKILNYEENKLVETLEKLDIKNINVQSKNTTVSLFGARGKDGVLNILTN